MSVPRSELHKAAQQYSKLSLIVVPIDGDQVPIAPPYALDEENCLPWFESCECCAGIAVGTGGSLLVVEGAEWPTWTLQRGSQRVYFFRWEDRFKEFVEDPEHRACTVPPSPGCQWMASCSPFEIELASLPEEYFQLLRTQAPEQVREPQQNREQQLACFCATAWTSFDS